MMVMDLKSHILAGRVVPGMGFNERVWAVTARIPRGQTATYADVARAVGGPDFHGYRAVGAALGRNPHAPAVPCHRVVGSDGRLCGFAGGLAQKQAMLEEEGVAIVDGRVKLADCRCPSGAIAGAESGSASKAASSPAAEPEP